VGVQFIVFAHHVLDHHVHFITLAPDIFDAKAMKPQQTVS
jgi:hypothetical protein